MELAASILLPEGKSVSLQSVSIAPANKPIGIALVRAVAKRMGISIEELLGGTSGNRATVQRYHELPGWEEAAAEVLDEEMAPAFAVIEAGRGWIARS